jgi:hypothetical protein
VASGEGMTLGEWVRKELLEQAEGHKGSVIEQTLLAEMLALRTILLNLHFGGAIILKIRGRSYRAHGTKEGERPT